MKRLCLSTLAAATLAMAATARDYIPLLEQGKEWRYTRVLWSGIYYPDYAPEKPREIMETYRIEGTAEIDGKEYHVLNSYIETEGGEGRCFPVAYLREDTEARKVWAVISEDCEDDHIACLDDVMISARTNLMYDFNFSDNTYILDFLMYSYGDETELGCIDGRHRGINLVTEKHDVTPYNIIEGIGLVSPDEPDPCNLMFYGISFIADLPQSYYYPYLYEVVAGSGDIIYYNENVAPGFAGVITEKADSDTSVRVFNLQGIPVKEADGIAGSTDGLAPGVYLIQTGATTRKILVGNR